MGFKPRRRQTRILCRNCRAGATTPAPFATCNECKISVCQHLSRNTMKESQFFEGAIECVWCYSMLVIEGE